MGSRFLSKSARGGSKKKQFLTALFYMSFGFLGTFPMENFIGVVVDEACNMLKSATVCVGKFGTGTDGCGGAGGRI
jgi:hypothetical protein